MLKLPKLPRIRGLSAAPKLRAPKPFAGIAAPKAEAPTANLSPQAQRAYYELCGDPERRSQLAQRWEKLKETYPAMTLPEAITYVLLEERHVEFIYQESFSGGRGELGGIVVDFLVKFGGAALAIWVQGNYWHEQPAQRLRDIEARDLVIGQYYEDMVITYAVELWESKLYSCDRERAVDQALLGVEVGK